ncbi:deoxyribonuclease-1-like [Antedon mediterranea]|uniref:deoxyribonuclease-1-like n=1 Tax=Antedon mediterranea TaxID=105859 RepID=UPI003AF7A547
MAVRPQILLATFCLITLTQVYSIKIGSFNIQLFGQSKVAKDDVVDVLVQILNRYDLLLIMEIRDKAGTAIVELLDALNNVSSENYKMVISSRTGRSTSKEQYTFFYKPELFEVTDQYEYDDGDEELKEDTFEREPFIVRFSSPSTLVKDFAMVGIHTKPDDAFNEIDTLADVYDDITEKWNIEDVIIAGDFNAGCSYVKDWTGNRLRQDRFKWLVKDDADTNVAHKQCPYDRFVIGGTVFLKE